MKNIIDSLGSKLLSSFDSVLGKKSKPQGIINKLKTVRKMNYGVKRSRFVGSQKIEVQQTIVNFPKLPQIASFLPWIYTVKVFS